MAADWNPPPPSPDSSLTGIGVSVVTAQETQVAASASYDDTIGETVFSKAWALSVLVGAVEAVERTAGEKNGGELGEEEEPVKGGSGLENRSAKYSAAQLASENDSTGQPLSYTLKENKDKDKEKEEEEEEEKDEAPQEIEESLETDLCRLWDASMNTDVSQYLLEKHAVELLLGVASRSHAPRLTEICIGILGNVACLESLCLQDLITKQQIQKILPFLGSTDSRILYETTRLIHTCLSHEKLQLSWLLEIKKSSAVYQSFLFILKSSTNEDLLRSTAVLLDRLLDSDEDLLIQWSTKDLVEGVCEAAEQARLSSFDATCTFVMSLQLVSTIESGIPVLVECEEQLCSLLCNVLLTMELSEERGEGSGLGGGGGGDVHQSSSRSLTAALSLLAILAENSSSGHVGATVSGSNIRELLENLQRQHTLSGSSTCADSRTAREDKEPTSPVKPGLVSSEGTCRHEDSTVELQGGGQTPNQRIQTLIQKLLLLPTLPSATQ